MDAHGGPDGSEVVSLRVEDEPDLRDLAFLEARLSDYNVSRTGVAGGRWLTILRRDDREEIVAGLHGWTWGDCFYVQSLWVREDLRRHGWGTRLLRAAEAEATARGCRRALLWTLDYQARASTRSWATRWSAASRASRGLTPSSTFDAISVQRRLALGARRVER